MSLAGSGGWACTAPGPASSPACPSPHEACSSPPGPESAAGWAGAANRAAASGSPRAGSLASPCAAPPHRARPRSETNTYWHFGQGATASPAVDRVHCGSSRALTWAPHRRPPRRQRGVRTRASWAPRQQLRLGCRCVARRTRAPRPGRGWSDALGSSVPRRAASECSAGASPGACPEEPRRRPAPGPGGPTWGRCGGQSVAA